MLKTINKKSIFMLLGLAAVSLSGCSSEKNESIVGTWDCKFLNSAKNTVKMEMEYKKNGAMNNIFFISTMVQGQLMEMTGTMSGSWSLAGTKLTEEVTKAAFSSMTLDGKEARNKYIENVYIKSVTQGPTTSTITLLNENSLAVSAKKPHRECVRKS